MVTAPASGRETLDSIERALKQVSDKVDRLNGELAKANQNKAELVARRLEAFRDLAVFRTRLALLDGVIDEADQLSAQVRMILEARQKTLNALKRRENAAEKARAQLLERQAALHTEIERLEKELDRIGGEAKSQLASDPDYASRATRYAEIEGMAAKAKEKAEKSRAEETEKGAPYRNDPLFMYLWERGYGTSRYDRTGVIRALDGWVARLIGYQDARSNFAVLTQIPERLEAHAARLRELLADEREALDRLEASRIEELAGADLLDGLQKAQTARETQSAELERLNAELHETGNQLRTYAEGLDPSFEEAVAKAARFLEGRNLADLRAEARLTQDPGDDQIVTLIGRLAGELRDLEDLAGTKRRELEAAFKRKEELLRIAADFRRAKYDSPGSVFEPGGNGEMLLKMLLEGAITAAEYWLRTQSRQRWRSRPADSYRRSDNAGFGGGSKRRSRSRNGPDFRTGGGF